MYHNVGRKSYSGVRALIDGMGQYAESSAPDEVTQSHQLILLCGGTHRPDEVCLEYSRRREAIGQFISSMYGRRARLAELELARILSGKPLNLHVGRRRKQRKTFSAYSELRQEIRILLSMGWGIPSPKQPNRRSHSDNT